jgi:hypothetical protein
MSAVHSKVDVSRIANLPALVNTNQALVNLGSPRDPRQFASQPLVCGVFVDARMPDRDHVEPPTDTGNLKLTSPSDRNTARRRGTTAIRSSVWTPGPS